MKLTFWGAAKVVTGSMHPLTVENRSYLLDQFSYFDLHVAREIVVKR